MSAVYEKAEQLPSPSCCESKVLAFELPANGQLKNGHAHRNWEAGLNVALRNTIPVSFLVDPFFFFFYVAASYSQWWHNVTDKVRFDLYAVCNWSGVKEVDRNIKNVYYIY